MPRLVLEFTVRAALIAGATAAVLRVMKVRSAAGRHRVWAGVVLLMLLLPMWLTWGPKAYLRVLPNATKPAAEVADSRKIFVSPALLPQVRATTSAVHPAARGPNLLLGLYLLGLSVLLARLAIGTVRALTLASRAVTRAGRLTSSSCAAPVTVGWLRPVVILPEQWPYWSESRIEAVWTHELEHARRRDPLVQWLALFNRAIFWFHPIAWWLERKLSALAEEACDTAVLESGHDPGEYSQFLLDLARSVMRAGTRVNVAGMAMPGSYLPQRIRQILAGTHAPRTSRVRMACAATACAVMSVALAAGTLVPAPERKPALREQHREFDSGRPNSTEVRAPGAMPKTNSMRSRTLAQIAPQVLLAQSQTKPVTQGPTMQREPLPGGVQQPPSANPNPNTAQTLQQLLPNTRRLEYLLGVGDQILIRTPQAGEIDNRPFRIDADGHINVPLLGRVHVDGMTLRELEADILQRLRDYVREPQVTITVVQYQSAPVFFVGQFKRPGIYAIHGSRGLIGMLTEIGGLGPNAGGNIRITRRAEYGPIPLPNATEAYFPPGILGADTEKRVSTVEISFGRLQENADDIPLQPYDVISVDRAADLPTLH